MSDAPLSAELEARYSPLHGFRGYPETVPHMPRALTIALSREAGARGGTIANRAGEKLGWQVYTQEVLEYVAQEGSVRQNVYDNLTPAAQEWVETQLRALIESRHLGGQPGVVELTRMVLALGAQGEAILLGRGAGCILPAASTLHVRLVAPLADRIAYMSQWLRLTEDEAAAQVRQRDSRRTDFISSTFQRHPSDVQQYDMVLNSSLLGEEACADLIVQAAHAKLSALLGDPTDEPA